MSSGGITMRKASIAVLAAVAAMAAPGAAQADICAPSTGVCVTGVEENVGALTGAAESPKEQVKAAADEAGVSAALVAATTQSRAVANAVLTPVEDPKPTCTSEPDDPTAVCVVGVGNFVVATEALACSQVPSPEAQRLAGWVADRCFKGYP